MENVFHIHAIRTAKSPSNSDVTTYFIWVNMRDLPANLPTDVNPRDTNMNTPTAKKLLDAVSDPDSSFEIRNSGIVVLAKGVKFNSSDSTVNLDFGDDPSRYGILDGGHTYKAIMLRRGDIPEGVDKFVKLEVLVGGTLDAAVLADARNTTVQVSDIALFNLEERFDFIKNAIADQPYSGNIAYKDNDSEKTTPVSELLKLMYAFNIDRFRDASTVPLASYAGKATVFKDYRQEWADHHTTGEDGEVPSEANIYLQLTPMIPTLVSLYERIQRDMPEMLRKSGAKSRGLENRKGAAKTLFTQQPIDCDTPAGYIMPIFGAFRALLERKSETEVAWQSDPLEMWDNVGASLVQNTFETTDNPRMAGKAKTLWQANYRIVEGEKTKRLLAELTKSVKA